MSKALATQFAEDEAGLHGGLILELQDWKTVTKDTIREKVQAVVETIREGITDPIEALVFAKKMHELAKLLEANVREFAESKGVGSAGLEMFSCKLSQAMTGVSYDYEACGDPVWEHLSWQLMAAKNNLKEREKFLQGVTKPMTIVDDSNGSGEIVTIHPPIKSGKLGLKVEMR